MTYPSRQICVSVNRPPEKVYEFASSPTNLPKWAEGLSRTTLVKIGDHWEADSPMGKVKVKFVQPNMYGVMDHDVTLPSGEVNHNPFRVVRNGEGSELIFTLYRYPSVTDEAYEQDAKAVARDLATLKKILET